MARYFHGGPDAVDPERAAAEGVDEDDKARRRENADKNHRLTRPHSDSLEFVDGQLMMKVPEAYWRYNRYQVGDKMMLQPVAETMRVKWEPGSITLALPGVGFWVVHPGAYIDIDVPAKTVKSVTPHLLTEAEAIERGIAQAPASPVKSKLK